jgi:predicted transcriptional regulator
MNYPSPLSRSVTAELDAETGALLDQMAAALGISPAAYAAGAIRRVVESEAEFAAFAQVGIDELDRGEFIPHEVVMAELDAMIAKHEARCRS